MLRGLLTTQSIFRCRTPVLYNQQYNIRQSVEEKLGLPEKPKKPNSAYIKFLNKIRPDIVSKNPTSSPTEVVKIGSAMWKNLSEAKKEALNAEYKKEYEKYTVQIQKYNDSLTEEQQGEIKGAVEELKRKKEKKATKAEDSKKNKELGKPVKPLSSFLLFSQTEKANRGERPLRDFQVYLGKKWLTLPENTKKKFADEAAAAKLEYDKKLLEWEKKMIASGNQDLVRQKTLKELGEDKD